MPFPPSALFALLLAGAQTALGATPAPTGRQPPEASSTTTLPEERVSGQRNGNGGPSAIKRFWTWSDSRLRDVFEAILPDTQERRTFRLTLQPHFRDLLDEDHVRLPVGVVYGFNRRTEGELEADTYFPNPFKDGTQTGIANLRMSFKRRWRPAIDHSVDAAAGFSIVRPLHGAPYELNEGVNRYSVFVTFARPSPTIENLEAFLNLSYDFITPSSADGEIREDRPQDDFTRIVSGVLYRKDRLTYGLALGWAHTVDGDITNYVTLTPSVIYDVPPKYVFNSRGQWQLGAALEAKRWADHTNFELRVRLRWLIDFRKAWRDWRNGRGAEVAP